ncbi:uncharacterized protein FOMMEDRAFT_160636 [Fomitiporia mediterranea MF3/22]|uniref:uncharacterized protein n=1 Tax=Fomitiporia mediterranea (strain MF3/22) TaxID=694068 RepID=UPI0004408CDB|nr:uncharacterized protein FOMMEDRAFT_160636 [Fomitiporia mediterranea MF3/22]EJC99562.1 hypothetical protein FOMMEDRAFT_160636 [Fomitiporia mediterranea MF3/22]
MDVSLDHVVDVGRVVLVQLHMLAGPFLCSGVVIIGVIGHRHRELPWGGQGASDEEGNRHAAVDIEQEARSPAARHGQVRRFSQEHATDRQRSTSHSGYRQPTAKEI